MIKRNDTNDSTNGIQSNITNNKKDHLKIENSISICNKNLNIPLILWTDIQTKSFPKCIHIEESSILNEYYLFIGYENGNIYYYNINELSIQPISLFLGHYYPICDFGSIITQDMENALISISTDGCMCCWKLINNGECIIKNSKLFIISNLINDSIHLLIFSCKRFALIYSDVFSSQMFIFDTWKMSIMHQISLQNHFFTSFTSLDFLTMIPSRFSNTINQTKSKKISFEYCDTIVLSLGSNGSLKCFLWAVPKNMNMISTNNNNNNNNNTIPDSKNFICQWKLEKSWFISWIDKSNEIIFFGKDENKKTNYGLNSNSMDIKKQNNPIHIEISKNGHFILILWRLKFFILATSLLMPDLYDLKFCSNTNRKNKENMVSSQSFYSYFQYNENKINIKTNKEIEFWTKGIFLDDEHVVLQSNLDNLYIYQFKNKVNSLIDNTNNKIVYHDNDKELLSFVIHTSDGQTKSFPCVFFITEKKIIDSKRVLSNSQNISESYFSVRRNSNLLMVSVDEVVNVKIMKHVAISDSIIYEISGKMKPHNDDNKEKCTAVYIILPSLYLKESNENKKHYIVNNNDNSIEPIENIPLYIEGFEDGQILVSWLSPNARNNNKISIYGESNDIKRHHAPITIISHLILKTNDLDKDIDEFKTFYGSLDGSSTIECSKVDENNIDKNRQKKLVKIIEKVVQKSIFLSTSDKSKKKILTSDETIKNKTSDELNTRFINQICILLFSGALDGSFGISEISIEYNNENENTDFYGDRFVFNCQILYLFNRQNDKISKIVIPDYDTFFGQLVGTISEDKTVSLYKICYGSKKKKCQKNNDKSIMTNTISSEKPKLDHTEMHLFIHSYIDLIGHDSKIEDLVFNFSFGNVEITTQSKLTFIWNLSNGALERTISYSKTASIEDYKRLKNEENGVFILQFDVEKTGNRIKDIWLNNQVYDIGISPDKSDAGDKNFYRSLSLEVMFLSYLLTWSNNPDVDLLCKNYLQLAKPTNKYSFGLLYENKNEVALVAPFPNENNNDDEKWKFSPVLSANLVLSIVVLSLSLMESKREKNVHEKIVDKKDDNESKTDEIEAIYSDIDYNSNNEKEKITEDHIQVLFSRIITQHTIELPEFFNKNSNTYREPALETLGSFGFHDNENLQIASRLLLQNVIGRQPKCANIYSIKLLTLYQNVIGLVPSTLPNENSSSGTNNNINSTENQTNVVAEKMGSIILILSINGIISPGDITPNAARIVCDLLLILLYSNNHVYVNVSTELLTKGFVLWRPHLTNLQQLIHRLLVLINDSNNHSNYINIYNRLLVEIGKSEPDLFLNILMNETVKGDDNFRIIIMKLILLLLTSHGVLFSRFFILIIDIIIVTLDPTKPERRKKLLKITTFFFHKIIKKYPMIAFHGDTQRFAISNSNHNIIIIYDLRTATKWRILEGHQYNISALLFNENGDILMSYSAKEKTVRYWRAGTYGLFGGLLGMQERCIKVIELKDTIVESNKKNYSMDVNDVIRVCRLKYDPITKKKAILIRENNEILSFEF